MKKQKERGKGSPRKRLLKEYITIIFHEHKKNYGYRKIKAELHNTYNLPVSEKVVRRLMKELGYKSQARRILKKSVKGKKLNSAGHIYENLLKRDFSTTKLNEKWVTDVTEIQVGEQKLYLSAIMDLHNNGIVGYQLSEIHDVQLVEDTLLYVLEIREIDKDLIIHSDQRMPYKSNRWKELSKDDTKSFTPSMSRKANALDNACIESFFSFLKSEGREQLKIVKDIEDTKNLIHTYIHYYNHKRIQGVLDYRAPTQYEKSS